MRACWDATLLVLVQPSPASCATCRGTSDVPRVLALTHRHLRKSPSVRQPFAEISGSISFSPPVVPFPETVPNFVCHFKGSLHGLNWTPTICRGKRPIVQSPARGLDQRDFAVKIRLLLRMELEGNAADRSDAFQHRERMPRVFGVLQASNHGLCRAHLLGELRLSQPCIIPHLAHQ